MHVADTAVVEIAGIKSGIAFVMKVLAALLVGVEHATFTLGWFLVIDQRMLGQLLGGVVGARTIELISI